MTVAELPSEPEFERTPPQDVGAEQCALGGMLLSADAIADVIEVLRPGDFYRPQHQVIYDATCDLYGRGEPADAVTVAAELTRQGEIGRVGGAPYLPSSRGSTLAKPPVRKLARDLGIDLSTVRPTGPGGVVTRGDVSAAAQEAAPGSGEPAGAPGDGSGFDVNREQRMPITGVRKRMAAATASSAFTAPHVTEFLTVDATRTVEAVERIRQLPDFAEVRVTSLLLTAKALILAVRRNPMINSTWDDEAQQIVVKQYVNLGVAVATPRGLLVPNVKGAEAMPVPQLARALADLVRTARAGETAPKDMQGGTISITNVGAFGVDGGTPILNPGEAAILALGAIRERPWVHDGQVTPRHVVTLSLSFDHRIVDGELGSRFLADIGAMLSDSDVMLAWG